MHTLYWFYEIIRIYRYTENNLKEMNKWKGNRNSLKILENLKKELLQTKHLKGDQSAAIWIQISKHGLTAFVTPHASIWF